MADADVLKFGLTYWRQSDWNRRQFNQTNTARSISNSSVRVCTVIQRSTQVCKRQIDSNNGEEERDVATFQIRSFHFQASVVTSDCQLVIRHIQITLDNRVWNQEWSMYDGDQESDYPIGPTIVKYSFHQLVSGTTTQFEAKSQGVPSNERWTVYKACAKYLVDNFDGIPPSVGRHVPRSTNHIPNYEYLLSKIPRSCWFFEPYVPFQHRLDHLPFNEISGFYRPTWEEWQHFLCSVQYGKRYDIRWWLPWYAQSLIPILHARDDDDDSS